MLEIARRLLTLALVLGAAWTAVYTLPTVIQVHPYYVKEEMKGLLDREKHDKRLMVSEVGKEMVRGLELYPNARLSPDAFMREQLKDRRVEVVSGPKWRRFFDQVDTAADCRPSSPAWRVHYGRSHSLPDYLYFRPDDPILTEVASTMTLKNTVCYVRLPDPRGDRYIVLTLLGSDDAAAYASRQIASPYLPQSIWFLVAALAVYVLIPRNKTESDALVYNRWRCIIIPDWLGFIWAGAFFSLALLVVSRDANMSSIIEMAGWGKATGWSLLFTLPGVWVLCCAYCFAMFSMRLLSESVEIVSWRGRREIALSDISQIHTYIYCAPRWLRILSIILFIASPRRGAGSMFLLHRKDTGIELVESSGRTTRISISYLSGIERFLSTLDQRGLALSSELKQWIEDEPIQPKTAALSGKVASFVLPVCLIVLWSWVTGIGPFAKLPGIPDRPITDTQIMEMHRQTVEMERAVREYKKALDRYEHAPTGEKAAAFDALTEAGDKFTEASKHKESNR